ncbi:MAG: CDP-glycerol glycerophosphotransferase family protein [Clostridiales bacterium]|nr:CDP-glycerol glycerophosphotransferase family protein [Clostridiales bacterium]
MFEIIELSWQRANLILKLNTAVNESAFLLSGNLKIPLELSGDILRIPLTNLPDGQTIEEGNWQIETDGVILKINSSLLAQLDDRSRIFRYGDRLFALLISFSADEELRFQLEANYMMKNTKYKKKLRTGVFNQLTEKAKTLITLFALKFLGAAYAMSYSLNKNKNRVLFLSENSDELSVNFIKLYDYISERHNCTSFSRNFEGDIQGSFSQTFKEMIACSKAKYIFLDNYAGFLSAVNLPKTQTIVQIWHAGVGFKSVGYARFGKEGSPHPFVSVHRKYRYAFVDDTSLTDIYSEVFGIPSDRIIASGHPRLADYTERNQIDKTVSRLYADFPLLNGRKTILFSPTYRGAGAANAYYDYSKIDLETINEFCDKNSFVFIIKMHPFINEKPDIGKYPNIIDLSGCDINDLIYIADIMITDYSSCCYEYSFFNRPLVFYRFDKELYEYERPIHTLDSFTDSQYEVCDFDSLMNTLETLKDADINKRFDNIKEHSNDSLRIISDTVFGEES